MPEAYLLLSHGSRDPRPEIVIKKLVIRLQERFQSQVAIGAAYLELQPQPLHIQIAEFIKQASASSSLHLKIVPLFLLPGVHVMEDIPAEIERVQKMVGNNIFIELLPYLGSHPGLGQLLEKQIAITPAQKYILLAHGSRRPGSEQAIETLAMKVNAIPAYWSVPSSLESQVEKLVNDSFNEIAIIPYFLFTGGITDAIVTAVEKLQLQKFPEVRLKLAPPLGENAFLTDLIWNQLHP